jgi:isopentenyl diphosphate isomerase/L-lactate dehydrogenase-like FMN-dependent dehydrogenase
MPPQPRSAADLPPFQSLDDLERLATAVLPPMVLGYYASGAEDEATLADNRAAWRRLRILPRVMVDVSSIDTRTTLFNGRVTLAAPILVAPMAMQRLAHPDGEAGMAGAAVDAGLGMVVSTMGTAPLEEVAGAAREAAAASASSSATGPALPPQPPLLFQLYVTRDRAFTASLVRRAEAAGYGAIVVTVDVPVLGKREADERAGFALPPGMRLANLEGLTDGSDTTGASASTGAAPTTAPDGSRLAALFQRSIDAGLTWSFVAWLKGVTALPIWVKGVLAPDDALLALSAGVDGIVVSNHGGRQLDGAPAAADCVGPIAAAVRRRVPVWVDGGVRRGADVLRALALGADGVLLGRPALYGLALGGRDGAAAALRTLCDELGRVMALAGCATLADARRVALLGPGDVPAVSSRL